MLYIHYVCMCVCVYAHSFMKYKTKQFILTNLTRTLNTQNT